MKISDALVFIDAWIKQVERPELPPADVKKDKIFRALFEDALKQGILSSEDQEVKSLKHSITAISQFSKEEQLQVLHATQNVFVRSYCKQKIGDAKSKDFLVGRIEEFLKRCNLKITKENIDFFVKIASKMDPRRFATIENYILENGAGINFIHFAGDEKKQRELVKLLFTIFSALPSDCDDELIFLLKCGDAVSLDRSNLSRLSWVFSVEKLVSLKKGHAEAMLSFLTKTFSSLTSFKQAHAILQAALKDSNPIKLSIIEKIPSILKSFGRRAEDFLKDLEDVSPKSERDHLLAMIAELEGKVDYSEVGPFLLASLQRMPKSQRQQLTHFFYQVRQSSLSAAQVGGLLGYVDKLKDKPRENYLLYCSMFIREADQYDAFFQSTMAEKLPDTFDEACSIGRVLALVPHTEDPHSRAMVLNYFLKLPLSEIARAALALQSLVDCGVQDFGSFLHLSLPSLENACKVLQECRGQRQEPIQEKWIAILPSLFAYSLSKDVEHYLNSAIQRASEQDYKILYQMAHFPPARREDFNRLLDAVLFAPITAEMMETAIEKYKQHCSKVTAPFSPKASLQEVKEILDATVYQKDIAARISLAAMLAPFSRADALLVVSLATKIALEHHISLEHLMLLADYKDWSYGAYEAFASFIEAVDPERSLFRDSEEIVPLFSQAKLSFSSYERLLREYPCKISTLGALRYWMQSEIATKPELVQRFIPFYEAFNSLDSPAISIKNTSGDLDKLGEHYAVLLSMGSQLEEKQLRRLALFMFDGSIQDMHLLKEVILPLSERLQQLHAAAPQWLLANVAELGLLFPAENLVEVALTPLKDLKDPLLSLCQQHRGLCQVMLKNLPPALRSPLLGKEPKKKWEVLFKHIERLMVGHSNLQSVAVFALLSQKNSVKFTPEQEMKALTILDENPHASWNVLGNISDLVLFFDDVSLRRIARLSLQEKNFTLLLQEILRQEPELIHPLYLKLLRDLQTSSDLKTARFLSYMLLEGAVFTLDDQDPLYQEALNVSIRVDQPKESNPYFQHEKLLKWAKDPYKKGKVFQDKVGDKTVEIDAEGVKKSGVSSISKEQYIEVCKKLIAEQDLARLVQAFTARLAALSVQDRNQVHEYIQASSQMTFSYLIDNLYASRSPTYFQLELSSAVEEKVPLPRAQLGAILAMIEQQDPNPKPGQLLSDREELLMRFSSSAQHCSGGKKEGIALFYSNMQEQYRYRAEAGIRMTEEQRSAYQLVCSVFFKAIEDGLSTPSSVVKKLCTNLSQLSHITIYLKNVLYPVLGISDEIVFDPYIHAVPRELLECKRDEVVNAFFRYFSLKPVAVQLQKRFQENQQALKEVAHKAHSSREVKNLFTPFTDLLAKGGFDPSQAFEEDEESGGFVLTEYGALALLASAELVFIR